MATRSSRLLVPQCSNMIDQWKYEFAAEMGLSTGHYGSASIADADAEFAAELGTINGQNTTGKKQYWGELSSRDTGAIGGKITARLIQNAEQILSQS